MNKARRAPGALAVQLHGRRIGTVTHARERSSLAFDDDYIEDPDRPTLSLSFKTATGQLAESLRPVHLRVPPFFSNLLPEGHLREYLAARAGVRPVREFPLLAALGPDLPGAVTAVPDSSSRSADGASARMAAEPGAVYTGALRFSLAGVQLKFSALTEAAGGLTIPASGSGGDWIVKLPSARYPAVPENEFVVMELARSIGIPVPRIRLVPVEDVAGLPTGVGDIGGQALAVQRFDRQPDGSRVHIEDFAQVFGLFPERKYDHRSYAAIARVLWAEAGEPAVSDFMRRLVFSILVGNGDMHLKNWSLIYRDGRTPALAPAYDLLSTLAYIPNDTLGLAFGGSMDMGAVTPKRIQRFAAKARLAVNPLRRIAKQTVEQTLEAWRRHDIREMLPDSIRQTVTTHMEQVAGRTA